MTAWTPKTRSLNRAVGSGEAGCLAAYCARMTGEYRKHAVEIVYETKPSTLRVGKSMARPWVDRRRQFKIGWG